MKRTQKINAATIALIFNVLQKALSLTHSVIDYYDFGSESRKFTTSPTVSNLASALSGMTMP